MASWSCQIIQGTLVARGVGLFTGSPSEVRISLQKGTHSNLVFEGKSYAWGLGHSLMPYALSINRHTCLQLEHSLLHCTEHLWAALLFFVHEPLLICVHGPEIPILDGSAGPWFRSLLELGLKPKFPLQPITLDAEFSWSDPRIQCNFHQEFSIESHWCLESYAESLQLECSNSQLTEVLSAQTFIDLHTWNQLRTQGAFPGAQEDSGLVYEFKQGKLEFPLAKQHPNPGAFAAHKMLDFLGDMALLGFLPRAQYVLRGAGHPLHLQFLKGLDHVFARNFAQKQNC